MTRDVARLLFDECLSMPIVARLAAFVNPGAGRGVVIRHVLEFAAPGTRDEDWIPRIKDEGWTVISADGGRTPNRNRGKKLPRLCVEYGITLFILSPSVHSRKLFEKTLTVLSVWDEIVAIAADPTLRGNRYMLEPSGQGNLSVGRLVPRPMRPGSGA